MIIGICDDMENARNSIKNFCKQLGYDNIRTYCSGDEFIEKSKNESVDLLFLDIEMGVSADGLQVRDSIFSICPTTLIAYVTNHDEEATNAYGPNVISFLSKPCDLRQIQSTIEKASRYSANFDTLKLENNKYVFFKDILYVLSDNKCTRIYKNDNTNHITYKPLKTIAEELSSYLFCQISRSAIINFMHYVRTKNNTVIMNDNTAIAISRRNHKEFEEKLNNYFQIKMLRK